MTSTVSDERLTYFHWPRRYLDVWYFSVLTLLASIYEESIPIESHHNEDGSIITPSKSSAFTSSLLKISCIVRTHN